jgi:hypothetical protein
MPPPWAVHGYTQLNRLRPRAFKKIRHFRAALRGSQRVQLLTAIICLEARHACVEDATCAAEPCKSNQMVMMGGGKARILL